MHIFTLTDAQILLGLSYADRGVDISCQELVASCAEVNHSIPVLEDFAAAFNKFLYVSVINLDGDKITLADFGIEIVNKARSKAGTNPQSDELIQLVLKELSGYKLKSMCNRRVWTQEQYQLAINTNHKHPTF